MQGKLVARTQSIVETDFRYEKNKINGGRVSRFKTVGWSEIQGGEASSIVVGIIYPPPLADYLKLWGTDRPGF